MKNTKMLLCFMFLLIILPTSVNAYELHCEEGPFKYNDTFKCNITNDTEGTYSSITGTFNYVENLECKLGKVGPGLIIDEKTANHFVLEGSSQTTDIISYECRVSNNVESDTQIQFNVNDFSYDADGKSNQSEILSSDYITLTPSDVLKEEEELNKKLKSTSNPDSLLRTLYDENIKITFSKFVTDYDIEVLYEVENLDLQITTNNPDATYQIIGSQELKVGENKIDINVTSPDGGTVTQYTLNIKRLARGEEIYYPQSDSSLSSLIVIGHAISFDKDIYEYKVHLTADKDSIEVSAVPTYEEAIVNISNTNNLTNRSSVVITVTSKDTSSVTEYKIEIEKDAPKKDYSQIIIIVGIVLGIIVFIIIFIKSSQKKANDPILSVKNKKVKVNKGEKFDATVVPEATSQVVEQAPTENINVVDLSNQQSVAIESAPVQMPELNAVTPASDTLVLTQNEKAAPIAVTEQTQTMMQTPYDPTTNVVNVEQPDANYSIQPNEVETLNLNGNVMPATPIYLEQAPTNVPPITQVAQVAPQSVVAPVQTVEQVQVPNNNDVEML